MILDEQTLLSDDQAITATAASTNLIDLNVAAPGDLGAGMPINFLVQVTEAFNNLTNLAIAIQVDDNASFSSAKTVLSVTVLLADLVLGKQIPGMQYMPQGADERYLRMYFTVTGTAPTTGKITAGVSMGNQTNITG